MPVKFSWANLELEEEMDWNNLAGRVRSQLHSMCTDAPIHGGFKMVAALLSMLLVASAYSQVSNLHVFGHDEVHYNHYFQLKLLQDGRWLNYIFRSVLVSIDASAWFVAYIAAHLLLVYRIARRAGLSVPLALIISAVVSISPPVVEQSMWPATAFSAVAVLILAEVVTRRVEIAPAIVYATLGILLFGTMQSYYFMVPLLFIGEFASEQRSARDRWRLWLQHTLSWVGGAVLGALVMSMMLLVLAGHFGPQVDDWRAPHPAKDLPSLWQNVNYVIGSFQACVSALGKASNLDGWLLLATVLLLIPFAVRRKGSAQILLTLALVAAAFHAFSIPLAPVITTRSLIALVLGLTLFFGLLGAGHCVSRAVVFLLLLAGGIGFQAQARTFLQSQVETTSFLFEKIDTLLPLPAERYSVLAVSGRMPVGKEPGTTFNNEYLMNSVVVATGARSFVDCRTHKAELCEMAVEGDAVNEIGLGEGRLRLFQDAKGGALIVYSDG
ncbi:hypothetical protein JAK50_12820 [Stenotrophomonas maltophilia]|uniref:glucosyltransferase domain-containing protein n=1 Tax=Stenotrophomonas sp. AS012628 TaxID=2597656 RepID=UPI001785455E|nr:glucosyltransferase domain-containing protein [Stenotrophomonas sp. AS012628]MCU1051396.1 hypothetical protein [Stenotrophomonas maltophilia]